MTPPTEHPASHDPIRVLFIDDDAVDAEMTRAMLGQIPGRPLEMEWASTFDEGLQALETGSYDVFLVDYFLDDSTGLDLLREARGRQIRTPMIMLTGKGSRAVDVQAMEAGAADYLVKGRIDPPALERSIRYALDRARAQEELRESEERHRGMFDHLPIGLYRCTPDGGFVDANPALVRMLGFPDPAELQEDYAATFYVGADDVGRFRQLLDDHGVVRGFESWLTRRDGVQIRVRNTARMHRTPDGAVQYLEGAVEDVTASSSELRIRADAIRYRTLADELPVALLTVDREGRITDANVAFQDEWGHGPTDLLMRELSDLVAESGSAELGDLLRPESDDGDASDRTLTCTLRTGDGDGRPARLTVAPVGDAADADQLLVLVRSGQPEADPGP